MILANGALLPDSDLPKVLSGLEAEINHTRSASPLEAEAVVDACATLLDRLDQGELGPSPVPVCPPHSFWILWGGTATCSSRRACAINWP